MAIEEGQVRGAEGVQALARRRAGAEWRRAADHALLEPRLVLADDRAREARAVAEAAEDRALADARLGGDRLHRHARRAVALEQPRGRVEHEFPVARGVGALGRLGVDLGEFEGDADEYNWTTVRLRATVIDINRTTVRIPSQEDTDQ